MVKSQLYRDLPLLPYCLLVDTGTDKFSSHNPNFVQETFQIKRIPSVIFVKVRAFPSYIISDVGVFKCLLIKPYNNARTKTKWIIGIRGTFSVRSEAISRTSYHPFPCTHFFPACQIGIQRSRRRNLDMAVFWLTRAKSKQMSIYFENHPT